ncbi:hypothetical protein [Streptomyces pratensis]|uniref:hypothetical protein n=1 Tax=Streptomyces pratensis TaxID=1169025 RepID=UPI001932E199|nr:hypothetical protein [Streptomyces pratensis]
MRRTRCRRAARIAAVAYVAAMMAGGLVVGVLDASHTEQLLFWLSQPGLNVLYVFVLMPLTVVLGDAGAAADAGGATGLVLACGLGAAVNVLLLRTAVCFARMVAADLPACRKRRTPVR